MALHFATSADYLSRDGTFLDPTADWTILIWGRLSVTNPGVFFRAFRFMGAAADDFANAYIYLGTFTAGGDDLYVTVGDGSSTYDSAAITPGLDVWKSYAIVYTAASHSMSWYVDSALEETWAADLDAAIPLVLDAAPSTGVTQTEEDISYERMYQAALTAAEVLVEMRSASAVRTTNLLTDCPLVVPGNLNDQSGNGNNWNLNGTATYTDGPLTPNVFPTKGYPPQSAAIAGAMLPQTPGIKPDRGANPAYVRYWQRHDDLIANAAQVSGPTAAGHVAVWTGDKQLADGGALNQGITAFDLSAALDALP